MSTEKDSTDSRPAPAGNERDERGATGRQGDATTADPTSARHPEKTEETGGSGKEGSRDR